MEVRRLSPDSLWIEMPLSAQTCLLVWHAMETCGLRSGKSNSCRQEYFGPLYDWQTKIVEGQTAQGIFDPQAKVQAQLSSHEGGTLLKFLAANTKHTFDLGSSWKAKRRLVPHIEEVLRQMPVDWQDESLGELPPAPIASPHDFKLQPVHCPPSLEPVVPLPDWQTSLKGRGQHILGCLPWWIAFCVASYLRIIGPLFLGLAIWEMWKCCQIPHRRNIGAVLYILFCLFWGIRDSWRLLQHWI